MENKKRTFYCSKVTQDHWVAKNRLEAEVKKIFLDAERKIIHGDKLEAFKNELKKRIGRANITFHRCKALEITEYPDWEGTGDIVLQVASVTHLVLYKLKL